MSDFSCNVKENIKRLETSLNVERNFDILQREVIIAGRKAGFFFIDGFVREDMAEKLMQFFYSLKESDITSLDIFLEKGMPYTEVTRSGNVDYVITQFLSGVSIMTIDGFDECLLIDCRTYPMRSVSEPWKDRVLRGSRDGFVETLVSNAALLRRSRDPEAIISEIRQLVADGVVEVMLLGQNVNSYGKNLENPITFARLLEKIEQIEGLERIRFMTSHPKDLSDELIEVMGRSKKICKHLHLPVQSGSSRILKKMNRHYTKEQYLELVEKIRKNVPDVSLTTDIIVGFPGETEEDFEETMDIVRKVRYDSVFTFIYSKRTGTPAAVMEDQVPEDVVKNRFDRLLKEVHTIAAEVCAVHEGTIQTALIESVSEHDPSMVTGRLSNNLLVHIKGDKGMIGRLADVRLTECKGFYYLGELAE